VQKENLGKVAIVGSSTFFNEKLNILIKIVRNSEAEKNYHQ
jgi:hypothetical protein